MEHRLLEDFKGYINYDLGDTTKDSTLSLSLEASEDFLKTSYGIHCIEKTLVFTFDGNGGTFYYFPYVITSVDSVVVDGVTLDLGTVSLRHNKLRLKEGSFTTGYDNVVITAKVGYLDADLPNSLKVAMFKLANKIFVDVDEARDSVAGYNTNTKTGVDFVQKHLPDTFDTLVAPYRIILV